MKYNILKLSFFILVLSLNSCIEPFSPPEVNSTDQFLVVDGFLNASNDTSIIELRHSQNTNDNTSYSVESGAQLTVESEGGALYSFTEEGAGRYVLLPVDIAPNDKYRLRIKRNNGQEYLSEYVKVSMTPPIDSLNYRYDAGRDAMLIQVNTHDPTGDTRFYRWKFEETYQYRSAYISSLVYNPETKNIDFRQENINLCWGTKKSNMIILGSTIKLTSDIIKDLPVNAVPVNTNKLYIKYSILVKQYGLSQEEFEYWTSLSKTTQGTGSLFDPQPSQVTGNIKNVANAKELVFGYFSVSKEETKRIFMTPQLGQFPRCMPPDSVPVAEYLKNPFGYLMHYHGNRSDTLIMSSYGCVDCRAQGGTNVMPSFWEY
jgi:hypothetical protein